LSKKLEIDIGEVNNLVHSMLAQKDILEIANSTGNDNDAFLIRTDAWNNIIAQVTSTLEEKHSLQPYRSGFQMEEIERALETGGIPIRTIIQHLSLHGKIIETNQLIHLAHFQQTLSPMQERNKSKVWQLIDADPFAPPNPQNIREILGQELFSALLEGSELVRMSEDVIFRNKELDQMSQYVNDLLESGQTITVASFRDKFATSRKFALAFLEYLDRQKVTRRDGDVRVRY